MTAFNMTACGGGGALIETRTLRVRRRGRRRERCRSDGTSLSLADAGRVSRCSRCYYYYVSKCRREKKTPDAEAREHEN